MRKRHNQASPRRARGGNGLTRSWRTRLLAAGCAMAVGLGAIGVGGAAYADEEELLTEDMVQQEIVIGAEDESLAALEPTAEEIAETSPITDVANAEDATPQDSSEEAETEPAEEEPQLEAGISPEDMIELRKYQASSSVPVQAYADEGIAIASDDEAEAEVEATSDDDNGPARGKTITANDDGTYTLSMNVTGKADESQSLNAKPLDIALVLDVSGSMKEKANVTYTSLSAQSVRNKYNETLFVKDPTTNAYQPVTCKRTGNWGSYTYTWTNVDTDQTYTVTSTMSTDQLPTTFYSASKTGTKTRMDALQEAVKKFLAKVKTENLKITDKSKKIQVTLIKYAGTKLETVGNDTYESDGEDYNNSQIVVPLTYDADYVSGKVDELKAGGGTRTHFGLQLAETALTTDTLTYTDETIVSAGAKRPNVQLATILFSDGEPGTQGFNTAMANQALVAAKTLKNLTTSTKFTQGCSGSTVYSIDANAAPTANRRRFMKYVSSNYMPAAALTPSMTSPGTKTSDNYSYAVSNDAALSAVFVNLFTTIFNGTAYVDVTMQDDLSDYVQFVSTDDGHGAVLKITDADGNTVSDADAGLTDEDGHPTYEILSGAQSVGIKFPANYALKNDYTYVLEYVVRPSQQAYEDYVANLNDGKAGYDGMKGDSNTGAASAHQAGFRTNDEAFVKYKVRDQNVVSANYSTNSMPHPVAQINVSLIGQLNLKKEWLGVADADKQSVTVDVTCTTGIDTPCIEYKDVKLTSDNGWQKTIWLAPSTVGRTYKMTERKLEGFHAAYTNAEWTLKPGAVNAVQTMTVTNYPTTADIDLSIIKFGKTVSNLTTDESFTFILAQGDKVVDEAHLGGFTKGEQNPNGAFTGAWNVSVPSLDDTGKTTYNFSITEDKSNTAIWDYDPNTVTVQLRVKTDTNGLPIFENGKLVTEVVKYQYEEGDEDAKSPNASKLAAFTNSLKPVSSLPLTGEDDTTARTWMAVAGGLGALVLALGGAVALWRKFHAI
ncbi:MAG: FctA domain-containing protein [Bifidobacterium sp.]|nr:FctA domain-containing protein [Bifidobacterium sp.]